MNATGTSAAGVNDELGTIGSTIHLPSAPGTYALILRCDAPGRQDVGALGTMRVQPGYYIYVGSALGPGGIRARVSRHLRNTKKLHWHIDYLRLDMPVLEIWYAEDGSALEHAWAQVIRHWNLTGIPAPGFGASDCRCESHLFFCSAPPRIEDIRERLESTIRQSADVKSLTLDRPAS